MDKSVVKKCIKRVAIASVAAVIGMNLFACTKPETDKITIEFDKDLKTNEQKSKEQESKTQVVTITPEEAAINTIPKREKKLPININALNLPKFLINKPNPSQAAVQKFSPFNAI